MDFLSFYHWTIFLATLFILKIISAYKAIPIIFLLNIIFLISSKNSFTVVAVGILSFALFSLLSITNESSPKKTVFKLYIMGLIMIFFAYKKNDSHGVFENYLPLGFSFVFLQLIDYSFDVIIRNRNNNPTAFNFFSSLFFFPTLYSGPFFSLNEFQKFKVKEGINHFKKNKYAYLLISNGLFKKMLANSILNVIDKNNFQLFGNSTDGWIYVIYISSYIYADFSSYSDFAIAISSMVGINLPQNFYLPYLSESFPSFWQRWHISLGAWFKKNVYDLLAFRYLPDLLNLNIRKHFGIIHLISVFITLILVGLWHSPNSKFLAWGLAIAILNINPIYRTTFFKKIPKIIKIILNYMLILFIQLLFFSESLGQFYKRIIILSKFNLVFNSNIYFFKLVFFGLFSLIIPHFFDHLLINKKDRFETSIIFFIYIFVTLTLTIIFKDNGPNFLYGHF